MQEAQARGLEQASGQPWRWLARTVHSENPLDWVSTGPGPDARLKSCIAIAKWP